MTLPDVEAPGRRGGPESLPTITRNNKSLYQLVLWFLGLALLLLIAGWIGLSLGRIVVPDALPVIIATIVGALVGVISTNKQAG